MARLRPNSATSGLLGNERRTIRFAVSAEGAPSESAEFFGLDKARLHAWALALNGRNSTISKVVYDTFWSPPVEKASIVVERWDERSAFQVLNAELKAH
jgi:hypothetical protein